VKKSQAIGECFAYVWGANLFENAAKIAHKTREKSSLKGQRVAHVSVHFLQRDT